MSPSERVRFYFGLGVIIAGAAAVLSVAWALVSWWTAGALNANGGWLVCVVLLLCGAGLMLRALAIQNAIDLKRLQAEREEMEHALRLARARSVEDIEAEAWGDRRAEG